MKRPCTPCWIKWSILTAGAEVGPLCRRDLLNIALQGNLGKPRPALVIQSDLFDVHASVTVLPLTGALQHAPLFRVPIPASACNGLRQTSQVMVDKPSAVLRERLGPVLGHADDETILVVTRALAVFLSLA